MVHPKNTMAVAEFQGQFFEERDLRMFSSACGTPVDVAAVVGANKSSAGVEAELDIQYIKSVAPGIPLTVIYDASFSLLAWANQLVSLDAPPLVASVSYGNDEAQQVSVAYMRAANLAFMKAGAMGISLLFASGDQGVCGREGCGLIFKSFKPDFPAASPYVTAVGGTDFAQRSVVGPEKAWANSGGGFSNTFGIPAYQEQAVARYKRTATLPPKHLYNNTGRGYPDVSALGGQLNPYCVVTRGSFAGVAGTSASSPVVAGVFARLNGLRLAAAKPPMGFLNPFIYRNPSGFQDVTLGTNDEGHAHGFDAVAGWDPATGVGTPDYEALSQLV
jgi:tripeptidyl-peptidase-1